MAKRVLVRSSRSRVVQPRRPAPPPAKKTRRPAAASSAPASWPKVQVFAPAGPAPDAVHAFEAAVRDLQRHKYQDAAKRLRTLLTSFPTERALLDRVRVYLDLCNRELQRQPAAPRTLEERLTLATAALNNGEDAAAEKLALEVLKATPDHDLALYLLAAVYARRGETDAALERLQRALLVSPDVRAQAKHDADFETLRPLRAFQEMLDAPPNGAPALPAPPARRPRPLRSGR